MDEHDKGRDPGQGKSRPSDNNDKGETSSPADKPQGPMPFHSAAGVFPMMSGEDYDKLVVDIKVHGQLEPIVLLDDKVLDGRNRERACRQLGIEPRYQEYDGDQDPGAYVWSKNAARRHLTVGQRAVAAAKLIMLRRGSNQHAAKLDGSRELSNNVTQKQAARLADISLATLKRVRFIQQHGTADDVAAVERGEDIRPIHDRIRAQTARASASAPAGAPRSLVPYSSATRSPS
jgi:ParB-like chromosome segregation protein Spo0J